MGQGGSGGKKIKTEFGFSETEDELKVLPCG